MIVASGIASIAALTIAGGLLRESPTGLHATPRDASEPGENRVAAHPPAPATTARAEPPRPAMPSPPPAVPTSVATGLPPPTAATIVQAHPPSGETSPSSDTNVVEVSTSAPAPQEYVLDIESIDLHEPVVAGDQDEINQGYVTAVDWSSEGYPASCRPDDGCTVWLAGHRSTHGAVFARLPDVTVGDGVEIHFQGLAHAYTVAEVVTVPGSSPPSVIHGDLVLQTSAPGGQRILIYAVTVRSP